MYCATFQIWGGHAIDTCQAYFPTKRARAAFIRSMTEFDRLALRAERAAARA